MCNNDLTREIIQSSFLEADYNKFINISYGHINSNGSEDENLIDKTVNNCLWDIGRIKSVTQRNQSHKDKEEIGVKRTPKE